MKSISTNEPSDAFYAFCKENDLNFEKDRLGRIVFDSLAYIKLKSHSEVTIKYIKKGGLIIGGSDQKGSIQVGYEKNNKLIILLELVNKQFISSAITSKPHLEKAMKINNAEISEPFDPFVIPSNCPKIELDNKKLSLIVPQSSNDRLFYGKQSTAQNINEILKLEKEIHKRRLGCYLIFVLILAVILLKIFNII